MRHWIWLTLVWSALSATGPLRAADERFAAELADGTRIRGDEIRNWHETNAPPSLNNKALFDPANPARWVQDTALRPTSPPREFVEFSNGDLLPGKVRSARNGAELPYYRLLAHLLVEASEGRDLPDLPRDGTVRVLTRWLRRVVWQRRASEQLQPGTLFYVDGRRLTYRSLRWNPESVVLLLEQETVEVPFGDIAELHLPRPSPWDAYFEQAAVLSPDGAARLMQFETVGGLRATGSLARFQARSLGNHSDPNTWVHLLQPAWALDPLWMRHRHIRVRRFFAPHQVPLSVIEPLHSVQKSSLGGGWNWQRDRNVQKGLLQNGGNDYGWGIGVHADHELEFELPSGAVGFRTRIGLDRLAAGGGCARGAIYIGKERTRPFFQSALLIGSDKTADTGLLPLAGRSGNEQTLTLVADSAAANRPPGADPFDIRDTLDWLEPEVELDPQFVADQIHERAPRLLPAWEGWKLDNVEAGPVQLENRWDATDPRSPRYLNEVSSRLPFLTWSRSLRVTPQQNWLVLAGSRSAEGSTPSRIQIRIDGRPEAALEVPVRNTASDPAPMSFSVEKYRGQTVTLEVIHLPGGPQSKVDWRGVVLAERLPGLLPVFEDDQKLLAQLTQGSGTADVETEDAYSGTAAIKVSPEEVGNARVSGLQAAIRENPKLGEYRYLRFAWKKRDGKRICLQLAQGGQWGTDEPSRDARASFRYDAGTTEPSYGAAKRLDNRLPEEWTVITRDLFADFGSFELTGLSLSAPDGEEALFDHIYLARTPQDFDRIAAPIRPKK